MAIRDTQQVIEVAEQPSTTLVRVSQVVIELILAGFSSRPFTFTGKARIFGGGPTPPPFCIINPVTTPAPPLVIEDEPLEQKGS